MKTGSTAFSRQEPRTPFALVTVTTPGYLQWTMTMIHSFLESNRWFSGDIVVVAQNLSEEEMSRFSVFPGLHIHTPSEELTARVSALCIGKPVFKNLAPMFFSLEIFNLTGYRKALFLDSDMVVVKSLEEVFNHPEPLCASAESCWYQGKGRRSDTYDAVEHVADAALFIAQPVNSGFMLVDESLISPENYRALVNMISPALWENKSTLHADQLLINLFFRDRITLLDARFNFRPVNAREIFRKDQITLEDASVIHYFRQYKPWNFDQVMTLAKEEMVHLKAFRIWYSAYINMLKYNHLNQKIKSLKTNGSAQT